MHGSLSGAYRGPRTSPRATGSCSRTRTVGLDALSAGRSSTSGSSVTMAIAARRLDSTLRSSRGEPRAGRRIPYRTPAGALYDSGDYEACLDDALGCGLRRARAAEARPVGRPARRYRDRLRRRAVDLEHGLHHARPDRRRARAAGCRSRGTPRARRRDRPARRDHRAPLDDAAGAGAPHGRRAGRRRPARRPPEDVTVLAEMDTSTYAWTVASGAYSSRFTGVGVGAGRRGEPRREKIAAIREHAGDGAVAAPVAGIATGTRSRCARAWSRASPSRTGRRRTSSRRTPRTASRRRRRTASSSTSRVEIDARDGPRAVLDYVTVHDAGGLLNPLLADGQVTRRLRHGAAVALFERHVYDEEGTS